MRTIEWNDIENCIEMIDQTKIPLKLEKKFCKTIDSLIDAIKSLKIRGAPALGAVGGLGIALSAFQYGGEDREEMLGAIISDAKRIKDVRPTAVNLSWGVNRVLDKVLKNRRFATTLSGESIEDIRRFALEEAKRICEEDVKINKTIGENGAKLLNDGDTILTHCNAGRLACVDWGTALGVVRSAVEMGKDIKVFACETRPLNQGGRITTWELMEDGIDVTLIADSSSGIVMRNKMVDKVIVGADRIVKDGVFNKIGTYTHSVLAKENKIPFYVAAPYSTFDIERTGGEIIIEEREADELRKFGESYIAPKNVKVFNPAFDFTPMKNITSIITEKGVLDPGEI
ncbi:MAG: S-methyl-5-thioribose-1-phosphate isomerase [Candidatus Methanolliviera hydrocarbonicum]|uniref:Putative methylthioribose-1-phosphate isomerase n=1 Tax=Candidatus Methanolliviera hydrocarbonicum TaxID=2491085 RepID=A0A520KVZ5_9EURY|nr:MAG: S-methyl-5-thioribose-1-phosphate isomerase [Candidatus Methanolliviera hydrocarbonicum]